MSVTVSATVTSGSNAGSQLESPDVCAMQRVCYYGNKKAVKMPKISANKNISAQLQRSDKTILILILPTLFT